MSVNSPVTSNEIKGFFPPGIVTGLGIILVALVVAKLAYGVLPYSPDANKGLALLIFIAILWFTEAVHISLTAIMIPIGALLLHLPASVGKDGVAVEMTMKSALAGFADPIIYLFLGGFALATALQVQKIDKKIASAIIHMAGSSML
ncbi:MAG: anion permease, partial [Cardiobacterium hominis]